MSFQKAEDLLRLASMAAGRQLGVSLPEICEAFGCAHRTAQRMTRALEMHFPNVEVRTDAEQRRRWRLRGTSWQQLLSIAPRDLALLETCAAQLDEIGAADSAVGLRALRDRLQALLPASAARRSEVDADALLEARGFASRPGPRSPSNPLVDQAIGDALTGPFMLSLVYAGKHDEAPRRRTVAPHGVILGARRYLVARDADDADGPFRHFRLDRILEAETLEQTFELPSDFDIHTHARRAFGAFQSDEQYGEVIWRFSEGAADHARSFTFHPDQVLEDQPDGSLVVRFHAAGWLEMCWHLYQWGDTVEVVAPAELREMVEGYRRSDFALMLP